MPGTFAPNPEFHGNYLDVVDRCVNKFKVILVTSNPAIRIPLAEKYPKDLVVIYFRSDEETKKNLIEAITKGNSVISEPDNNYINLIKNNWDHWHTEAELFCIENKIPYIEVSNTKEAEDAIKALLKENN